MKFLQLQTQHGVDLIVNADHVAKAMPQGPGSQTTVLTLGNGEKIAVDTPIGEMLLMLAAASK